MSGHKQDPQQWTKYREQWEKDREEWEKDRKGIYLLLGRLTRSLSDFYNRFDQIDSRQADITEILRELKEDKKKSDNNED